MQNPASPRASGFLIAVGVIAGAVIGAVLGQPSIGLLAGGTIGVAAAIILWLADRRG